MATIANLNVMLTASASGFTSVMRGAVAPVHALGSAVEGITSKIFSLTGALTGIAGGAGFALLLKNSMESIATTGRLSDRLGISTEKLGGLEYASKLAGVGTEELTGGLEKMLKSLGEAAEQGGPAAAALAAINLNAKTLAAESPDQAFTQIAEGLKNIQNPYERARLAQELFGKSGQQLLPLLLQGAEGIKAAEQEATKLGLTFSRVDAAKVELANQSFVRMQGVIEGAGQTLAIQLSPFIEAAVNKLVSLTTAGRGAGSYITEAFGTVLEVVAEVSDYLAIVEAGWQLVRSGASFAVGGILDGIAYVIDGLNKLATKLHITAIGGAASLHQLAGGFYDVGKEAFAKAGEDWKQFSEGTNAKAAARAMAAIQDASNKAATSIAADAAKLNGAGVGVEDWSKKLEESAQRAKKVGEILDGLQKDIATFGQTEGQKKLFDLKELGASPEQLAGAQQLIDKLDQLGNAKKAADSIKDLQKEISQIGFTDAQKRVADLKLPGVDDATLAKVQALAEKLDAMKQGAAVWDETRTPMEKYETKIGKLSDLLNSGAIDWNTYGRAVAKARAELEETAKTASPDLFQANTAAAEKYLYEQKNAHAFDATAGAQKQSGNSQSKDALAQQEYSEVFNSRLILQRIENALDDANADTTQVVDIA